MLAIGHGPLAYPPALARAREDPALADRIVEAYEPKAYDPEGRYVVIGAGIASVNEWANALDTGAKVISLLRSPTPDEQDLNTPRCFFEALGIDAFQSLPFDRRLAFLGQILKGTAPRRRGWEQRVREGREQGRFEQLMGEIDEVLPGPPGCASTSATATGRPGLAGRHRRGRRHRLPEVGLTLPLLRRLVQFYDLPVEEGRLLLRSNCGVPRLDRPDSRLCMMGIHANPVIPHGDTIAGLKYVARRFVADCARAERIRYRRFPSRLRLQLSLAGSSVDAIRRVRRAEQLA